MQSNTTADKKTNKPPNKNSNLQQKRGMCQGKRQS